MWRSGNSKEESSWKEIRYLDALVRGVYARHDLPKGYVMDNDTFEHDFYMAIPLQKGQLSCREIKNGEVLVNDVIADKPVMIDDIDSPYAKVSSLKKLIYDRGIWPEYYSYKITLLLMYQLTLDRRLKILLERFGFNKTIGITISNRVIQAGVNFFIIILISLFLTKAQQGYYYTFNSMLAMQVFLN